MSPVRISIDLFVRAVVGPRGRPLQARTVAHPRDPRLGGLNTLLVVTVGRLMVLPSSWRPQPDVRLIRVGPASDGGYVLPVEAARRAQVLVSLGLSDDWRFEEDFRRISGARVECFDHTVHRSFWRWRAVHRIVAFRKLSGSLSVRWRDVVKKREYDRFFAHVGVTHHQVMVGFERPPSSLSLTSVLRPHRGSRVFVKMDIEGWEYRVLDQILDEEQSVLGFLVEFHDVDLHRDWITHFVAMSRSSYVLAHVHANNFGPLDEAGDPTVLEMTWVRADLAHLASDKSNLQVGRLDYPNDSSRPETPIRFEPPEGSDRA